MYLYWSYRVAAYQQFIYWTYHRLVKGIRKVILSCVVQAIRKEFPEPTNIYTGFKLADLQCGIQYLRALVNILCTHTNPLFPTTTWNLLALVYHFRTRCYRLRDHCSQKYLLVRLNLRIHISLSQFPFKGPVVGRGSNVPHGSRSNWKWLKCPFFKCTRCVTMS